MFVAVWGCGGTWPEFSVAIFSVFALASCLFLSFGYCDVIRGWDLLSGAEKILVVFLFLFATLAFSQCFVYNMEAIQRENLLVILPQNIPSWLPSSVDTDYSKGGALKAFASIFCAVSAFVFALLFSKRKSLAVCALYMFAATISAAGLFGILQKASYEHYTYGVFYSESAKYGTFFISNSAGAVFNLGLCASLALVYYEFSGKGFVAYIKSLPPLAFAGLCAYAAFDCESVGALCIACLQVPLFIAVMLFSKKRIKWFFIVCAVAGCAAFAAAPKIADMNFPKNALNSIESRVFINSVSLEILKTPRLWGTGGGSYGFYATPMLVEHTKNDVFRTPQSIVNAHNDILEFAIEYGIIGCVLMAGMFLSYLAAIKKNCAKLTKTNAVIISGLLLCLLHSLTDLHLHVMSALIIAAFAAALALANFGRDCGK